MKITIEIKGVSAELVLGNYMPKDQTIYEEWQDFYRYDDIIHESQLLSEYVSEITVKQDNEIKYTGKIPLSQYKAAKSFCPAMEESGLYLRTECIENAVFQAEFETDDFQLTKLFFETQDYDLLFKTGTSFITRLLYGDKFIPLTWLSATPVGNICLLCHCKNGFLVPIYDAVNKKFANSTC